MIAIKIANYVFYKFPHTSSSEKDIILVTAGSSGLGTESYIIITQQIGLLLTQKLNGISMDISENCDIKCDVSDYAQVQSAWLAIKGTEVLYNNFRYLGKGLRITKSTKS
jgi:hypothetical protein